MRETLAKLRETLYPLYGKNESEAMIRLIFNNLKNWTLTDILIHQDDSLSSFIKKEIDEILERLQQQEPIQYILRQARFYGMDLKIKPGVLIPRPETEELADIVIDENKDRTDLKVLDVCTGSGCLAIALARNLPFSTVTALDISTEATDLAIENAKLLKTRIKVVTADIFDWTPDSFYDIIVSNPPYVMDKEAFTMEKNVLDYEPHEALFVPDDDPLRFYNRIADIALKHLNPDGRVYFEINPLLCSQMKSLMENKGFSSVTLLRDISGKYRFLSCVFQPSR